VTRLLPLALLLALAACTDPVEPDLVDEVHVVLYTSLCEPEAPPEDHFTVSFVGVFDISWEALCTRDGRDIGWWALKVSFWEDRAEDAWNVWMIDPEVDRVWYGQAEIEGAEDPYIVNESWPDALVRVGPTALQPGDYRVEIWGVVDDYLDSQRSEVRLTVVDP